MRILSNSQCLRASSPKCLSGALSVSLLALLTAMPAQAQVKCDEALVPQPANCARSNADITVRMPAGANDELIRTAPGGNFANNGFSISIDGQTFAGAPAPFDPRRPADIAAAAADIDIRYDGLDSRRLLNVTTTDLRAAYRAGEQLTFRASTNYPAYVARAEIRVTDRAGRGQPLVAVLPVLPNGEAVWTMPASGPGDLAYALRVYDAQGRYDETAALDLARTDKALPDHLTVGGPPVAAGEGQDRTRLRNIPVHGGVITVSGTGVVPGSKARVMGEEVPVDASGRFVTSRILPAGDHIVAVDFDQPSGHRQIVRDAEIPRSEWFYFGVGDLTFGKRLQADLIKDDPDYSATYVDGRLAYYVKGKTQSGYRITSSLDTGEGPLDEMFKRLNDKDPRRVIARLDPEDMYPTYGDDSSAFDDTPTSGRFYLRVEKDASSVTWGDFKAGVTGAQLLSNTRALYGAELRYATPSVTTGGEPRAKATLYAAQPDSLPQRDILRGTGGSVYFLTRQDINGGSETLVVQTIDPDTGRVVSSRTLTAGVDYEIDYIQGVVILTKPLSASASDGGLISSGGGAYYVNLVAQYEYTPTTGSIDGASLGGRAEVWVTDNLRLGATGLSESTGTADQRAAGVDVRYVLGKNSYVEAEAALTSGPGFGRSLSTDGGLTITADGAATSPRALAYRIDGRFDLRDFGLHMPGQIIAYAERKDAGFSTLTEDITEDQTLLGIDASVQLNSRLTFGLKAEDFRKGTTDRKRSGEVQLAYDITDIWSVEAGIAHLDKLTTGDPSETGNRTDAALRLNYRPSDDLLLYGFGQATIDHTGGLGKNDRLGFGFDTRLSEKVTVAGELSDGTKGTGGLLRLGYAPTADNEVYLGYTLDPTRTGPGYALVGRDQGTVVLGGKYRYSETVSSYTESNWDLFGNRRSLTRAYGVTYTPTAKWTFSGAFETGEVRDAINGDFDRDAYSLGIAYVDPDGISSRGRLEYRTENGDGVTQDRTTWALSLGSEYKVNDNWRFMTNMDALFSDSAESDFRDGEYLEASVGYAYRPVENDRLNALFRYTYLHDLPGEDQVTADGSTDGPLQKSHVLSVDANYDLTPKLTFGGKYGYRRSQIADRGTTAFADSTAHLAILRLDWKVVHKWDVLAEARMLWTEETDIRETGALVGVYRQIGNNAKIGVGYEWGQVSDNPTDLDYVASGIFLNIVGKF